MGWTEEQFRDLCKKAGVKPEQVLSEGKLDLDHAVRPRVKRSHTRKKSYENSIRAGIQKPLAKPNSANALVEKTWGNSASNEGVDTRTRVSIEGQRVQCIDPDNYTGGLKALIDCLQHSGLIPQDSWEAIHLETKQTRVKTAGSSQEKTIVTIEYLEP